jgi:uncharacterized membrane protein
VLAVGRRDPWLRFHAWQSIVTFGGAAALIVLIVLLDLPRRTLAGFLLYVAVVPAVPVVWLWCITRALRGERFALPGAGRLADRLARGGSLAPPPDQSIS